MHRILYRIAAFSAALSVIIGACGAHFLKTLLTLESLNSIHTAVNYQMIHSLAIIAVGLLYSHYHHKKIGLSGYLFVAGIVFFSGSIYLLAFLNYLGFERSAFIGLLTPIGGLFFIFGWFLLFLGIPIEHTYIKKSRRQSEES